MIKKSKKNYFKSIGILLIVISCFFLVYCETSSVQKIADKDDNSKAIESLSCALKEKKQLPLSDFAQFDQGIERILRLESMNYGDTLQGLFWKDKEYHNTLYLSFDDGPNLEPYSYDPTRGVTEVILDTLKDRGLRATFFINGKYLDSKNNENDQQLRWLFNRMIREGHLIGNHSYSHYNLAKEKFHDGQDDLQDISEEFQKTQDALDRILGYHYPLILVRPPYAEPGRTQVLDQSLIKEKHYLISLQLDTYDYAYKPDGYWQENQIYSHVKEILNISQGGMILMHDRDHTAFMLNPLLDIYIKKEGFNLSSLDLYLQNKYGALN